MPASVLAALLLLAVPRTAPRPQSRREFAGYLLGQYASNVKAKLGEPTRTDTDTDGEALWHYDLAPGGKTVLTFSITKDEVGRVSMIEVTGAPLKGSPDLFGVSLGMAKADALQKLGDPDTTEARDETPGQMLDWKDRNYYAEVNAEGKIDRIQIVDNSDGYPKADDSKPDLKGFRKALASRDRAAILDFLCADIDIYTKADDTVNFAGSPVEDLANEETMISRYLFGGSGSVRDLLTDSLAESTAPEKDDEEEDQWVSDFESAGLLSRIVWTFEAGRWRVWEIWMQGDDESRHLR